MLSVYEVYVQPKIRQCDTLFASNNVLLTQQWTPVACGNYGTRVILKFETSFAVGRCCRADVLNLALAFPRVKHPMIPARSS
jgi:hypothetical protein